MYMKKKSEFGEFWLKSGMQQGWKLSAQAFIIYLLDLEKKISKITEGCIFIIDKKY